jgi:uncharacterized protein DUF1801
MADLKTKVNNAGVEDFLNSVGNAKRREDAFAILKMMKSVTRQPARMWGPSIVGFDKYHYKYASGREGEICMIGFSPRSQALTLYVMPGFETRDFLLKKLGKYTTSKGCLYIRKLEDVDMKTLKQLVTDAYQYMKKTYK